MLAVLMAVRVHYYMHNTSLVSCCCNNPPSKSVSQSKNATNHHPWKITSTKKADVLSPKTGRRRRRSKSKRRRIENKRETGERRKRGKKERRRKEGRKRQANVLLLAERKLVDWILIDRLFLVWLSEKKRFDTHLRDSVRMWSYSQNLNVEGLYPFITK